MIDRRQILNKIKEKSNPKAKPELLPKIDDSKMRAIRKKDIFNAYAMWYTIPLVVKNMTPTQREAMGFTNDAVVEQLVKIRTKSEFSKVFDTDMGTLKDWEKGMAWKEVDANMKKWLKVMTSRVRMALVSQAIKTGKAAEVIAFEKIVNDFSEKTSVEHSGEIYNLEPSESQEIKKLFNKNAHRRGNRK